MTVHATVLLRSRRKFDCLDECDARADVEAICARSRLLQPS
jgi:hypothetical protein